MKRLLFIHTIYREQGGEDIAVSNEISLFKEVFDVEVLEFSNSEINFFDLIYLILNYNFKSVNILKRKIIDFQPDIIYIHNTWFKGSLGVFKILKKSNVEVLLKLHNFRYQCTKSYLLKKHIGVNSFCLACGLKNSDFNFFNKYFKNSYLKSLLVNRYGKKYFKILKSNNLKILVLTNFHKQSLIKLGFESRNIFVFKNYLEINKFSNQNPIKENSIIYAGRISEEKGVEELIKTFLKINDISFELKLIGDGPYLNYLSNKYQQNNIKFLGKLENTEVLEYLQKSRAVVTATKLYEGQPNILCEASFLQIPSIFPDSGGIKEFFPEKYQYTYSQFNYDDLRIKLEAALKNKNLMAIGIENEKHIKKLLNKELMLKTFTEICNA